MTIRWKRGKKPALSEVRSVVSNAVPGFIRQDYVDRIAIAVLQFINDRVEEKH